MTRILNHLKGNVVGYVALFIALGGISYAAIRIPAGSVGTRALKNHSVTPKKLDRSSIGGYVRFYAQVAEGGQVLYSRPRPSVVHWNPGPNGLPGGELHWRSRLAQGCFSIANAESSTSPVVPVSSNLATGREGTNVTLFLSQGARVNVAVICPQP